MFGLFLSFVLVLVCLFSSFILFCFCFFVCVVAAGFFVIATCLGFPLPVFFSLFWSFFFLLPHYVVCRFLVPWPGFDLGFQCGNAESRMLYC